MKQYCGIHRYAVSCQDLFLYRISIVLLRYKSSSNATVYQLSYIEYSTYLVVGYKGKWGPLV